MASYGAVVTWHTPYSDHPSDSTNVNVTADSEFDAMRNTIAWCERRGLIGVYAISVREV